MIGQIMLTIYLAGDIPKGDEEAKGFKNWRVRYQEVLDFRESIQRSEIY
jgi:hypothetical protein